MISKGRDTGQTVAELGLPELARVAAAIAGRARKNQHQQQLSYRPKVDTSELLKRAIQDGKQLLLPKVVAPKMPLAFFEVRPDSSGAWPLTEGAFGVQEPNDSCTEVPLDQIDLWIVPALALDTTGARLGWGGGFYDRL